MSYRDRSFRDYDNRGGRNEPKKHTGCKTGSYVAKKGSAHGKGTEVPFVRGWNYSKRHGMRTFLASPYSKTKQHKSKTGRIWENWMVTVQQEGQKDFTVSGLYDPQSRKVIINELSMVMNPNAPRGGYCGRFYSGRK